ncbi:unnamed protein product [Effrenium voratum]|nr:unnamed protein product [Effrenium voratum]CAJ1436937.1 unnamed protein product [Effrenium voratum]
MTERDVQLARVVELFTKHGASNGLVPAAMLKKVMGACCPTLSQREVERLVEAMDTEKNGKVPLTQFIAWMFRTFEDVIEEWRTDKELEKISETLPSGLQKLGLSFVCPDQFTDVGLAHIGNSLPATLQTLALAFEFSWTECKISNEGFGKLVAKLPQGLLSLDLILRNDELTDEALEALGRAMPGNLTRAAISFKDNDSFTDKGMSALIASTPASTKNGEKDVDSVGVPNHLPTSAQQPHGAGLELRGQLAPLGSQSAGVCRMDAQGHLSPEAALHRQRQHQNHPSRSAGALRCHAQHWLEFQSSNVELRALGPFTEAGDMGGRAPMGP